jgi:hypothetical protein
MVIGETQENVFVRIRPSVVVEATGLNLLALVAHVILERGHRLYRRCLAMT